MADISEVVTVNITVQDSVPAADSFGVLLLLGYTTGWLGMKTFTATASGLTALVAAGVPITHPLYAMLSEAASQNPKISTVKIWARTTHAAQTVKISPTNLTAGYVYSIPITDGTTSGVITYTNGGAETTNTIATALATAATALAVGTVTGTHSGTNAYFTLGVSAGTVRFHVTASDPGCTFEDTSTDGGIATDLAAALAADSAFYGVCIETTSAAEIAAANTWCTANKRLFAGLTFDSAPGTTSTTDVMYVAKATATDHAYVQYSADSGHYAQVGLLCRQLSRQPGSSTWFGKKILGCAVDNVATGPLDYMRGKNGLTYVSIKGVSMTLDGKAAGGRFLDIVIGIDWLTSIIQNAVLVRLANSEKVDMSNEGITLLGSDVGGCLQQAQDAKLVAPGWKVTSPDVSTISTTDKGNRTLKSPTSIQWSAVIRGAVQNVQVDGTLTL